MKNKGFTLIELLVVVLIIGILASIALPQYYRAVNRAKFAELDVIMDAAKKNSALYIAAHGWNSMADRGVYFTGEYAEGDIEMPGNAINGEDSETDLFNYTAGCNSDRCYVSGKVLFISAGFDLRMDRNTNTWYFNDIRGDNAAELCRYARDRGYDVENGCDGNDGGDDGGDDNGGGEPPLG